MEYKDIKSRNKRHQNMTPKSQRKPPTRTPGSNKQSIKDTTSSSQVEAMQGVIDVADSSDDRYAARFANTGWATNIVPDLDDLTLNDDEENAQLQAGDFDSMAQMPASIGDYFKFASEKNWDTEGDMSFLDKTEASEYFTLNLKLLNMGLQTIPFYKRMDYPSSMFTRQQLNAMDKAAEDAEKQYQTILQEQNNTESLKDSNVKSADSKHSNSAKPQRSANGARKTEKDELDELLSMTADEPKHDSLVNNIESNKELTENKDASDVAENSEGKKDGIQEWLDTVLDE